MQSHWNKTEQYGRGEDRRLESDDRRIAAWPRSFPIIDHQGCRVSKDRRKSPDRRLSSFEVSDVVLAEKVFEALFQPDSE